MLQETTSILKWRRGGDSKNTEIAKLDCFSWLAYNFLICNMLPTFSAIKLKFYGVPFWLNFHQKRYHWYHLCSGGEGGKRASRALVEHEMVSPGGITSEFHCYRRRGL